MERISRYEFKQKSTSCDRYRAFKDVEVISEKSYAYDNAIGMLDIIKGVCWDKEFELDDIYELCCQITGYEPELGKTPASAFSPENEGLKNRTSKKAMQYLRYCKSELGRKRDNLMMTLELPTLPIPIGNYEISVRPQALFSATDMMGTYLTAVFFADKKCGSGKNYSLPLDEEIKKWDEKMEKKGVPFEPSDSARLKPVPKWVDEYVGMKYCQHLIADPQYCELLGIPVGSPVTTTGATYYMEFKSADAQHTEFFDSGSNITTLSEQMKAGKPKPAPSFLDEVFTLYAEKHYEGVAADACTPEDCKWCANHASCGFQKSPQTLERVETTVSTNANNTFKPTKAQQELVSLREGYHLCIARAGSGKTASMKNLVLSLIADGISLDKVLMTTFTNNGVKEFQERLIDSLRKEDSSADLTDAHICTFHGFALEIIRDNFEACGYTAPPREINEVDKARVIFDLIGQTRFSGPETLYQKDYEGVMHLIGIAIKVFDTVGDHPEYDCNEVYGCLSSTMKTHCTEITVGEIMDFYPEYEKTLREENVILFCQHELFMQEFLKANPDYIEKTYGFEYVILDEFQDSNDVEMETVRILSDCPTVKMIVAVGDDGQSIYAFRNAVVDNIVDFEQKLGKPVHQINMLENWRSTPEILDLADRFLDLNVNKTEGHAIAGRKSLGIEPVVKGFHSRAEEDAFILSVLKEHHEKGLAWDHMAIIARTNAELDKYVELLSNAGIPYIMRNPVRYLSNSRVKAAIALIRNIWYQPDTTAGYFAYLAARHDGELLDKFSAEEVQAKLDGMKNEFAHMDDLSFELQRALLHKYLDEIRGEDEIYVSFLDEYLYTYPDIEEELRFVSDFQKYGNGMKMRMTRDYEGVALTTAHSSKGLEWDLVINTISKYDSKILHSSRHHDEVEETRRLLYVSMTRARDYLYVTGRYVVDGTKSNKTGPVLNQFVEELIILSGQEYDPVDPNARKKKESRKKKAEERSASKAKSREMTEEEKERYQKATLGSFQTDILSFVKK